MTEIAVNELPESSIKFHHVHAFVDELKPLTHYKAIEEQFNTWHELCGKEDSLTVAKGREIFQRLTKTSSLKKYVSHGQDLISQLITGMSFRITAAYDGVETRTFSLSSSDPNGAKFVISAVLPRDPEKALEKKQKKTEVYNHFDRLHLDRFAKVGRPGFAILAFEVRDISGILDRFKKKHPMLLLQDTFHEYQQEGDKSYKVLDAFAFYNKEKSGPDRGTVLRFLEFGRSDFTSLIGMKPVDASFPKQASPVYSDHWVSNVIDRNGYCQTLKDTLGFTPKVNFNAGVVAAGEAMIESTVAGNNPTVVITDPAHALVDRSQIYLPINNALSEKGHVYLYLKEIGQGVQHIANRTEDVVSFIQQANDTRKMTGSGFSFLNIPRLYYGRLAQKDLCAIDGVSDVLASRLMDELTKAKFINKNGIVNIDITNDQIASISSSLGELQEEFNSHRIHIQTTIKNGIYNNMLKLLGNRFDESEYLKIVKNKILVDIQGRDVLYQIFSSCVMQETPGTEAPFIETIQRFCGDYIDDQGNALPIKPGCGGFGIRNFLTLFLSIEVTKAMGNAARAREENDLAALAIAEQSVTLFEEQLNESNPILTTISDAMTAEQDALDELTKIQDTDLQTKEKLEAKVTKFRAAKEAGQGALKVCAEKYKLAMRKLSA